MKNELPRCPQCFRNTNVRPYSIDARQQTTYECSACTKMFKVPPPERGCITREIRS